MSDHDSSRPFDQPVGEPEYLEQGGGAALPAADSEATARPRRPRRRPRRTALLVVGGLVLAGGAGVATFAAMSFFKQGDQPAEALPASTMAYAAVDLDPSGGQKIDALRTLNKFPAIKDQIGVTDAGQLRQRIGDEIIKGIGCNGLTFSRDLDPWMGNRAAVAAVDLGRADPAEVVVLQVKDDDAATAGITKLSSCGDASPTDFGFDVSDGWAVIAQSKTQADQVVAATKRASLADDATYQKWVGSVGDAGVVNMYVAPSVGGYLATKLDSLGDLVGSVPAGLATGTGSAAYSSTLTTTADTSGFADTLKGFTGAAATLRFSNGGIELAVAGDPGVSQGGLTSDQGGSVVAGLPDDTAAALGVGLEPGWFSALITRESSTLGGQDSGSLMAKLSRQSGLDLPKDAETLAGSSLALSISKDFDLEQAENATDASGLPVALTVKGDTPAIEAVISKLTSKEPDTAPFLGTDSQGDLVSIGGDAAYRKQVLAGGDLGGSDAFTSVIPDAVHASGVFYMDFDLVDKLVASVAGGDRQVTDNLAPLRAVGFSTWNDDGVSHALFRISTD